MDKTHLPNPYFSAILGLFVLTLLIAIWLVPERFLEHFMSPPAISHPPASHTQIQSSAKAPSMPLPTSSDPIEEQSLLGDYYLDKHDFKNAALHYGHAALCGDVRSQDQLSTSYEKGQGVQQDYSRAYLWIKIAHALGQTDENTERRIVSYMRMDSLVSSAAIDEAMQKWIVRRPDQSVSCQTLAVVADAEFLQQPFLLN